VISLPTNKVKLRLYHDDGDPDTVTALLGIEPTRIQRVGEVSDFPEMNFPLSGWFLEFNGDRRTLEAAIERMVDLIGSHAVALAELRDRGWEIQVKLDLDRRVGYTGKLLSPQEMRILADAEIECQLWTFAMPPWPPSPAEQGATD